MRALALTVVVLTASGCAYTVQLTSTPIGALVTLPDGVAVRTPTKVTVPWGPGHHYPVVVEAEGYEPLPIDLQRAEGRLLRYIEAGFAPRAAREVRFVLVPITEPLGAETR
jgi:hypothetical protein